MGMLRPQEHSIPSFRGRLWSGLASDVHGEVQIDGHGLVVDGAGTEVELAYAIDDAGIDERAERLDDVNVLGLTLFVNREGELDLGVCGDQVERKASGK